MIYLKQLPNGNRVASNETQYQADLLSNKLLHIIRSKDMVIWRLNGPDNSPKIGKPLRYGGRNRGGGVRPWAGC